MNLEKQKEILNKVIALVDNGQASIGRAALLAGINVKKLIDLRDNDIALKEKDFLLLEEALEIISKK